MTHWYDPLRSIESLGSLAERPGSLAGLAEARRQHHLGQFFTPDALAGFLWRLVEPAIRTAVEKDRARVAILDNSVGSGRLLQFADPDAHVLGGVDVHGESVAALMAAAEDAGFECQFAQCGMELARPRGWGVALLNPPFSVHLESPALEPFPCTAWGRFGHGTSATSHVYAIHQALAAADVVAAIVPVSLAEQVSSDPDLSPRLRALFALPPGLFQQQEGTDVAVRALLFGRDETPGYRRVAVSDLDVPVEDFGLSCRTVRMCTPLLRLVGIEDEGPSITTPVTGDPLVRVARKGRRILLGFRCGLTEAKVRNAILRESVLAHDPGNDLHRYPANVRYTGQGGPCARSSPSGASS